MYVVCCIIVTYKLLLVDWYTEVQILSTCINVYLYTCSINCYDFQSGQHTETAVTKVLYGQSVYIVYLYYTTYGITNNIIYLPYMYMW